MSHSTQNQDEEIVGINVVPLVDIVLVLLIVFMVTANFMAKPAIDMELPSADTGERKERNQFSLLLGDDGSLAIGEKMVDEAEFEKELHQIFNNYKEEKRASAKAEGKQISDNTATLLTRNELTMIIQADKKVSHGRIIHCIDAARKVGILKYAFNVDPSESRAS